MLSDGKIYDKDLNEVKSYYKIKGNATAPILPFAKGTLYIKVDANYSYNDSTAPTDCIYHLKVKFTATSSWESEYNDSNVTADTISPNKTYSGIFYHSKDVDF